MLQCLKDRFFCDTLYILQKSTWDFALAKYKKGLIGIPEVAGEEGADDASTEEDRLPEISNESL